MWYKEIKNRAAQLPGERKGLRHWDTREHTHWNCETTAEGPRQPDYEALSCVILSLSLTVYEEDIKGSIRAQYLRSPTEQISSGDTKSLLT